MSTPIQTRPRASAPGGARRRWLIGAMMAASFLAGGLALPGISAMADETGMHAMMGGPDHGHMAAMAHMTAVLDQVGATADQKTRIATILHTGLGPMMRVHGDMRDVHGDLLKLLTAPTVDRAALEQMRAGEIAKLDQASRTATQALAAAAEVLSPDQRAKLAALIAEHHPAS
jgi:protein CpxP